METIVYNISVKRVRGIKNKFNLDNMVKFMFGFSLVLFIIVVSLAAVLSTDNSIGFDSLGFTSFQSEPMETNMVVESESPQVEYITTALTKEAEKVVVPVESVEPVKETVQPAYQHSAEFVVTAYCACEKCCGKWSALQGETVVGAAGKPLVSGVSVAVDNSLFKFGTELHDDEGNTYIAADTGSGVNGYHIDIYMNDHQSAREVGKYTKTLYW